MPLPKRMINKATLLWKATDQGRLTLETTVDGHFLCTDGDRLARMVTAAEEFGEPMWLDYPLHLFEQLKNGNPVWLGRNERATGKGVLQEFESLKENMGKKRFTLAATFREGLAEYLIYHVQELDPMAISFVPVAQLLDDADG